MTVLQDRIDDARVVADALASMDIPVPEVSMAPDGDFEFEWFADSKNLVCVYCKSHKITFVGMLNGQSAIGRAESLECLPPGAFDLLSAIALKMQTSAPT